MGTVAPGSRLASGEEGELLWQDTGELDRARITASTSAVLQHYFETGIHNDHIYTGTMHSVQGEPAVSWSVLEDLEE